VNGGDNAERCERLMAEIIAIEHWDLDYHTDNGRGRIERDAHRHRQERRREIMTEILSITDYSHLATPPWREHFPLRLSLKL
jgi:hypothetical protein